MTQDAADTPLNAQSAVHTALDEEPVGETLRRTREEYGEDLRAVAAALRISCGYLDAIEKGRYGDLPGKAYAAGWIRSYGDYLGLDVDDLLERFQHESRNAPSAELKFPEPDQPRRAPGFGVVVVGLLLAAAAYAAYAFYFSVSEPAAPAVVASAPPAAEAVAPVAAAPQPAPVAPVVNRPPPQVVAAAPERDSAPTAAPESAPQSAPAPTAARDAVEPASPPPEALTPEPVSPTLEHAVAAVVDPAAARDDVAAAPVGGAEPPTVGLAETSDEILALGALPDPAESPDAPAESAIYGAANADARIILEAAADSWVQIRDTNTGETLLSRLMFAGDKYQAPNRAGVVMRTGNAGGLRILVDGVEAPAVGPSGAVRSNVQLDPVLLLSGEAYTPPARRAPAAQPPAPAAVQPAPSVPAPAAAPAPAVFPQQ